MEIRDVSMNNYQKYDNKINKTPIQKDEIGKYTKNQEKNSENNSSLKDITNILQKKLDKIQKIFNSEAKFEVNDDVDMVVVKIVDKDTKEVIRQIPPETSIKLAKALNDLEGILFDEQA
ncbi:flagellar protein FlaG [Oceanotoga sp. DSM 15011]|jgi:flagellar protein FlaG|uniref:Flagellar protein FlaG n=1 Tax=Oceanotoga teriensis TaxID=515440 RepID=A0AA45C944_9BACT|nr:MULTISPECIES: flagellar protein FlaG [Oceanotoga]MDN5341581.1 flagellar protein FlaG [Oceanotoga sp.]MDO7977829.1 flagellar protein FlaG [Oceanotoga teriensis]PWJ96513.1 flagellar protein FlaG [Oceanotoga teriensis]UYP00310.1 flagellar protein FlaG [Oceanotoga sp. DSM 15011]